MPGSAIMGDNLIDDLMVDVDDLRGDLNADFGTRPFQVQTIKRTWLGESGLVGDGDYRDEVNTITPTPRVEKWDGYKWVMLSGGFNADGTIQVSEVSLTYTWDELTGGDLQPNQQFLFRMTDAHGQMQGERMLRQSKPPYVDREKTIGWIMWLMNVNTPDQAPVEVEPTE